MLIPCSRNKLTGGKGDPSPSTNSNRFHATTSRRSIATNSRSNFLAHPAGNSDSESPEWHSDVQCALDRSRLAREWLLATLPVMGAHSSDLQTRRSSSCVNRIRDVVSSLDLVSAPFLFEFRLPNSREIRARGGSARRRQFLAYYYG